MKLLSKLKAFFTGAPPTPPPSTGKLIVIFSDGRCALVDNADQAQALVMNECLQSGGVISADFRRATPDEVAALTKKP